MIVPQEIYHPLYEDKESFYGDNLYMKVPKVSPGQTVTIVTKSAKGERGLTTDSEEY